MIWISSWRTSEWMKKKRVATWYVHIHQVYYAHHCVFLSIGDLFTRNKCHWLLLLDRCLHPKTSSSPWRSKAPLKDLSLADVGNPLSEPFFGSAEIPFLELFFLFPSLGVEIQRGRMDDKGRLLKRRVPSDVEVYVHRTEVYIHLRYVVFPLSPFCMRRRYVGWIARLSKKRNKALCHPLETGEKSISRLQSFFRVVARRVSLRCTYTIDNKRYAEKKKKRKEVNRHPSRETLTMKQLAERGREHTRFSF